MKKLEACSNAVKMDMSYPLSELCVLTFVTWCLHTGLKASSISTYLSGLKTGHKIRGLKAPNLRTEWVNIVLTGGSNKNSIEDISSTRLPCTLNTLRLIKKELILADLRPAMKTLIFAACTTGYYGACRMGELLCKKKNSFDPRFTLTREDISISSTHIFGRDTKFMRFKIKHSKTNKSGTPEIIDIYETGNDSCPIKAIEKHLKATKNIPSDQPLFCDEKGVPLLEGNLNKVLDTLLKRHLAGTGGTITCHSFRCGLITLFASLGHGAKMLKEVGRWSSRAHEIYIKLGRSNRAEMAKIYSDFFD